MSAPVTETIDNPLRLRELLHRTCEHGSDHKVSSVVIGFAVPEGDLLFPDFLAYVQSELRVEDAILRLTRERAVLFLSDVMEPQAKEIIERIEANFQRDFPTLKAFPLRVRYMEIRPDSRPLSVRDVLPAVLGEGALD